jgi:hypothetical protein
MPDETLNERIKHALSATVILGRDSHIEGSDLRDSQPHTIT